MKGRLQKWGNSLGIRIPKLLIHGIDLQEGSEVNISSAHGKIVIEPSQKRYQLAELLEAINEKNLHEEVDIGKSWGKEIL